MEVITNADGPTMTLNKKHIYILTAIFAINMLTLFVILPYGQQTANSHMNNGPFLGIVYFILAALTTILAANFLTKHRDKKIGLGVLLIILTFVIWGLKLYSLYCIPCAKSG